MAARFTAKLAKSQAAEKLREKVQSHSWSGSLLEKLKAWANWGSEYETGIALENPKGKADDVSGGTAKRGQAPGGGKNSSGLLNRPRLGKGIARGKGKGKAKGRVKGILGRRGSVKKAKGILGRRGSVKKAKGRGKGILRRKRSAKYAARTRSVKGQRRLRKQLKKGGTWRHRRKDARRPRYNRARIQEARARRVERQRLRNQLKKKPRWKFWQKDLSPEQRAKLEKRLQANKAKGKEMRDAAQRRTEARAKRNARLVRNGEVGKGHYKAHYKVTGEKLRTGVWQRVKNFVRGKPKVDPSKVVPITKNLSRSAKAKRVAGQVYRAVVNPVTKKLAEGAVKTAELGARVVGKVGKFGAVLPLNVARVGLTRALTPLAIGLHLHSSSQAKTEQEKDTHRAYAAGYLGAAGLAFFVPGVGWAAGAALVASELGLKQKHVVGAVDRAFGKTAAYATDALMNDVGDGLEWLKDKTIRTETGKEIMNYAEKKTEKAVNYIYASAAGIWGRIKAAATGSPSPTQTAAKELKGEAKKEKGHLKVLNGGRASVGEVTQGATRIPANPGKLEKADKERISLQGNNLQSIKRAA